MAQNEMKAKPALPERVRSMEGLGTWYPLVLPDLFFFLCFEAPAVLEYHAFQQPAALPSGSLCRLRVRNASRSLLGIECNEWRAFPVKVVSTHEITHGEPFVLPVLAPAINGTLQEVLDSGFLVIRDTLNFTKRRGLYECHSVSPELPASARHGGGWFGSLEGPNV